MRYRVLNHQHPLPLMTPPEVTQQREARPRRACPADGETPRRAASARWRRRRWPGSGRRRQCPRAKRASQTQDSQRRCHRVGQAWPTPAQRRQTPDRAGSPTGHAGRRRRRRNARRDGKTPPPSPRRKGSADRPARDTSARSPRAPRQIGGRGPRDHGPARPRPR